MAQPATSRSCYCRCIGLSAAATLGIAVAGGPSSVSASARSRPAAAPLGAWPQRGLCTRVTADCSCLLVVVVVVVERVTFAVRRFEGRGRRFEEWWCRFRV